MTKEWWQAIAFAGWAIALWVTFAGFLGQRHGVTEGWDTGIALALCIPALALSICALVRTLLNLPNLY